MFGIHLARRGDILFGILAFAFQRGVLERHELRYPASYYLSTL